jgi:hypothetical protein
MLAIPYSVISGAPMASTDSVHRMIEDLLPDLKTGGYPFHRGARKKEAQGSAKEVQFVLGWRSLRT